MAEGKKINGKAQAGSILECTLGQTRACKRLCPVKRIRGWPTYEGASGGSSLETRELTLGSGGTGRGTPGPADGGSGIAGTTLDTSVS